MEICHNSPDIDGVIDVPNEDWEAPTPEPVACNLKVTVDGRSVPVRPREVGAAIAMAAQQRGNRIDLPSLLERDA